MAVYKVELQVVRVLAVQGCAVVLEIAHTSHPGLAPQVSTIHLGHQATVHVVVPVGVLGKHLDAGATQRGQGEVGRRCRRCPRAGGSHAKQGGQGGLRGGGQGEVVHLGSGELHGRAHILQRCPAQAHTQHALTVRDAGGGVPVVCAVGDAKGLGNGVHQPEPCGCVVGDAHHALVVAVLGAVWAIIRLIVVVQEVVRGEGGDDGRRYGPTDCGVEVLGRVHQGGCGSVRVQVPRQPPRLLDDHKPVHGHTTIADTLQGC